MLASSPAAAPARRAPARWRSLALAAATALALLPLAERGVRAAYRHLLLPASGAQLIWAQLAAVGGKPATFFAASDVELPFAPEAARVLVAADEAYQLWVNGELVGAGAWTDTLDVYDVSDLVRPGRNRLVAELRSTRGVGAFLLRLEARGEGEHREAVTGPGWRILWRSRRALLDPGVPLDGGAEPWVWGAPPVGRWAGPWSERALPRWSAAVEPAALRARQVPWNGVERGQPALFDFGSTVTGYLTTRARTDGVPGPAGLVYLGLEPPDPARSAPATFIVPVRGRRYWQDVEPRSFRYALFAGGPPVASATALPVRPGAAAILLAGASPPGVFGLRPPRLRTAVEDEVWREVQSFEGGRGREAD